MAFYENTLIVRQDLAAKEVADIKNKYNDIINNTSGKVIKIEEWGLINLSNKIKKYNKGFFIHYKFEGINETLEKIKNKIKVDSLVIRHLTVRYKELDKDTEFFKKKDR